MNTQSLIDQALALHRSGSLADAERLYRAALAADPRDFTARHLLGVALAQQGRSEDALREIAAALALRPGDADALLNHANVLKTLGRPDEALAGFSRALEAKPGWPQALNNRGTVLQNLGRFDDALADYDAALAAMPNYVEALNNRGSVLQDLRRPAEALAAYDQALRLAPQFAAAFNNRGSALLDLRRFADALGCFDRALALRPGDAETLNNRGNALQGLMRYDEAVTSYDRALAIRPDYPEAQGNRGGALQQLKRHDEALASFEQAGGQPAAFGGAAMAALNLCDWERVARIGAQMPGRIAAGEAVPPWVLLGYSGDEMLQLECARNVIRTRFPQLPPALAKSRYAHDKIRLAYISSDFLHHPVAAQIAQLIESHDRGRFEVLGISTGPDDGSAQRRRLMAAFDQFHDVKDQPPRAVAELVRRLEVDVLVDLNGHTQGDSFDVLAHRPAPVQATWLGYAGTTGAPFIDYLIADRIVAPNADAFSEKLAYLPNCFFPTDTGNVIGTAPSRAQAGLPEHGFVFCSFNNNWKFTAPVFALWMRLLQQVPGSVLWLKKPGEAAAENLRRAAREQGIDPARLVFAAGAPLDVHFARHALADLFLDTLPYNAHATACDALWAGLPVLTCAGTAYAGRVAASMLQAADLPELVTQDTGAYESLALELAHDPARLAALRQKLIDHRANAALFNTPRFARDLEAIVTAMHGPGTNDPETLFHYANALKHLKRTPEALAAYDAILALRPGDAAILNNRGNALRDLERHGEALDSFTAAIAARPGYANALFNRGQTLCQLDRLREGFADITDAARLFHADSVNDRLLPHKVRHDAEQKDYLAANGIRTQPGVLHWEGGEQLASPAMSKAGADTVEQRWRNSDPKLVVIDDLLTQEALEGLRRFCWGSTIWRTAHTDGYLGAFPENGFSAPLLVQIAEELRAAFPAIFKDHPLLYAWAFKYDSQLGGTEIHADEAAVNVNFWITPDEANLDPGHGGLVVWDKAAPLEWDFAKFNDDARLARGFLSRSGAKPITVPHRANRAVIFDSDLFHETDTIRFAQGYQNRRINVTLLYGRRENHEP